MVRDWIFKEKKKFWLGAAALAGITFTLVILSLFFVDQRFADYFGSPDRVSIWLFHREITEVGAAEIYFVFALLALLTPRYRKKGAYFLASLVTSGLALHILKIIFGRTRPHKAPDHDPFLFDFLNFHHHFQSLPSGHSQTLFTAATFLAFLFPKWAWAFLVSALYLSFTRAVTLAHFVSDVWLGAALGIFMTVLTLRFLVKKYGS